MNSVAVQLSKRPGLISGHVPLHSKTKIFVLFFLIAWGCRLLFEYRYYEAPKC